MRAASFEPSCGTFIVSMSRPRPGHAIEIVSVTTAPHCGEIARAELVKAARDWLEPRRCFLDSIQQLHVELDLWAVMGAELETAAAAELELLGVPAAGRA